MGVARSIGRAVVLRGADLVLLARAPRLLAAYLRVWALEYSSSPYVRPRSFATALALEVARQDPSELVYGETPIVTARGLLSQAGLRAGDRLLDLGAGRGRVLVAARLLGAQAFGLDIAEQHVVAAARHMSAIGAELRPGDAASAEIDRAAGGAAPTHVFLAWTGFSKGTRERIVARLAGLPAGTRIVTVTWPIDDPGFGLLLRRRAAFTWGRDDAFVFERRNGVASGVANGL